MAKTTKAVLNRQNLLVFSVISLAICSVLAASKTLPVWESNLLNFIYLNIDVKSFWYIITQSAGFWGILALIGVFLVKTKIRVAAFVALASSLAFMISSLLKLLIARPRPGDLTDQVWAQYDHITSIGFGFPSSHAAIAAAVGLVLFVKLPKKFHPLIITWVLLVGVSRLVLGVHAPLDILGGLACGVFAFVLAEKLMLKSQTKK